jgi:ubiquinone/menaquinone biosynthesis C-methylase UbiE
MLVEATDGMKIEQYYDEKAKTYDAQFSNLYYRVYDAITWRYLEPHVPANPNALVLDAAGGTGKWSILMGKKGCRVVLADVSEGMLRIAHKKIKDAGLEGRIALTKGDITKLDYPDESFDLVLCEHALFVFPNPEVVIKELVRVLKRNCPLVVSAQSKYVMALSFVPQELNKCLDLLSDRYFFSLGLKNEQGDQIDVNVHLTVPHELERLLVKNGLRVEKIIGKCVTMPLRIGPDVYLKADHSYDLFNKVLQIELALCEKPDALGLAGHLQAIAFKV